METVSNICAVIVGISMFVTPVLFLIWVVKKLRKKPAKKMGIATLIGAACFAVFLFAGAFTDPATYCDHEYKLVDSETATCEKGGYEKYHCDLCGRGKTEKLKKLGHDMVEVRRVAPTYDADGEYVKQCSRCGYEEIEVLEKLVRVTEPTETQKPTEATKPTEGISMSSNDWEKTFADAGFSGEEIEKYREIIETIGVTEFHDVEIIENGIMHIVRGKIYDSSNLQLNVTLENREIIYIELAGIPDVKNVPYINWRGKLKYKKVNTKTSVELYSDTEGGYEGVLVWEDKFIYPCDTNGNILEE